MALTSDSFRDPRRMYTVKVVSGFFISRDKVAKAGDILQFPRSRAHELVSAGQAVFVADVPLPAAVVVPEPAAPVAAPQKSSKEK
jgi:hypothetical protein